MATVSTRKPAPRKTLAEQLTCAQARARTAKIALTCIGCDARGFLATVTSERDASTTYTIRRDVDGTLSCTCPATVVCKHIGACLNEGASYHTNAIPASQCPVTPNPNRPEPETAQAWATSLDPVGLPAIFDEPQPEPPAPAPCGDALPSVLANMPYQQRCTCCGESWHVKALAAHYICPRCERNDREQVEDYATIASPEAACLVELLDRETTVDEWEEDERPEAEKQADAERRAKYLRRQAQEEIEREAAKHAPQCSSCRKQPAASHIRGQLCQDCYDHLTAQMQQRQEAKRREAALPLDRVPETFSVYAEVAR